MTTIFDRDSESLRPSTYDAVDNARNALDQLLLELHDELADCTPREYVEEIAHVETLVKTMATVSAARNLID